MQEDACVRLRRILKIALIPEQAFVIEKRIALRVPIAGDFQRGRFGEIVFDQRVSLRVSVHEVAVTARLIVKSVEARSVRVDDSVPVAVQADAGAMIHVDEQSGLGRLLGTQRRQTDAK